MIDLSIYNNETDNPSKGGMDALMKAVLVEDIRTLSIGVSCTVS